MAFRFDERFDVWVRGVGWGGGEGDLAGGGVKKFILDVSFKDWSLFTDEKADIFF